MQQPERILPRDRNAPLADSRAHLNRNIVLIYEDEDDDDDDEEFHGDSHAYSGDTNKSARAITGLIGSHSSYHASTDSQSPRGRSVDNGQNNAMTSSPRKHMHNTHDKLPPDRHIHILSGRSGTDGRGWSADVSQSNLSGMEEDAPALNSKHVPEISLPPRRNRALAPRAQFENSSVSRAQFENSSVSRAQFENSSVSRAQFENISVPRTPRDLDSTGGSALPTPRPSSALSNSSSPLPDAGERIHVSLSTPRTPRERDRYLAREREKQIARMRTSAVFSSTLVMPGSKDLAGNVPRILEVPKASVLASSRPLTINTANIPSITEVPEPSVSPSARSPRTPRVLSFERVKFQAADDVSSVPLTTPRTARSTPRALGEEYKP
jgi:hypothetical protein